MTIRKTLVVLLLIALAVWGIEVAWLVRRNVSLPKQIREQAERERRAVMIQFRDRDRKLNNDYSQKKYLATGETVYDRIFNAKDQSIIELIQRIAAESLPKDWSCEVRVEEFTHCELSHFFKAEFAVKQGFRRSLELNACSVNAPNMA